MMVEHGLQRILYCAYSFRGAQLIAARLCGVPPVVSHDRTGLLTPHRTTHRNVTELPAVLPAGSTIG